MAKKKKESKPAVPASLIADSPWSRVAQEVSQAWELRKELIGQIEEKLQAKVIVYFTSFNKEQAMILDGDAEMIENILSVEHSGGKVALILNSAGGSGLAAERIVNVCRAYSNNDFEVIVPHMAKSAATLICFGCACIRMSQTAELGPVDPQVKYITDDGKEDWISAEEYVSSYEDLIKTAISGKAKRVEALVQQLVRYDARYIEKLKSAQALSEGISIKLLKSGMMSQLTKAAIKKKIKDFLIHRQTAAHGRMITMAEAEKCGLKIEEIELRSALWELVWELYVRGSWTVSVGSSKILESTATGLRV
jgi:ClpP class serine protease